MDFSKDFLEKLKLVDQTLDAFFDYGQDSICVWSTRAGQKDSVLVMKREHGELYRELEHRALTKLRENDIWKKYGDAKSYNRILEEKEEAYKKKAKAEYEAKRMTIWKEHKREIRDAMENAKSGILSGKGKVQDKNWVAT